MKKIVRNAFLIVAIAGSFALYSCKDAETNNENVEITEEHEMHSGEHTDEKELDAENDQNSKAKFSTVTTEAAFKHYIQLKDALVATNAEAAKKHAEELAQALAEGDDYKEVRETAMVIVQASDISAQRDAFATLTSKMETVLQNAIESGEIYKQHCPMAFEGKGGNWFSDSKEIRNPYYGDKMLKCGRVDATITK